MAGIIVELIAVFLVFCAALWFGVAWPYLVFPLYLGVLSFKVTPMGKKLKMSRLFLGSLTVGLLVGFLVGRFVFGRLTGWSAANAENDLIQFFFGPAVLRVLWSAVIGFMLAFDLLAVFLIPLAFFSAQGKYGDFEAYRSNKWLWTRTALFGLLGLSQGTLEVRDGKVEALGKHEKGLARIGGPGDLIVQQGHAVILEKDGRVTRIVSSGLTPLRTFERVSMVVPLGSMAERVSVHNVITKDMVILDRFECWVFHKVDAGLEEMQVMDGQFSYNERTLLEKVWKANGKDWREAIQAISTRCMRHVIGDTEIEKLIAMTDDERKKFNERLQERINRLTTRSLGVSILGVDADAINIPAEVANQLLAVRMAAWAITIAQHHQSEMAEKGKGEAAYLGTLESARARAQSRMIQAILEGLQSLGPDHVTLDVVRDLRYIEALEKIADDTTARVLFPYGPSLTDIEQISRQVTAAPISGSSNGAGDGKKTKVDEPATGSS
ncbi:MAG TPA: SPFH domain-containing protein [Anaerolineae bacterium]|nr:SPFH domain-containing protein [Anaerolineae bacterium]